MIAFGTAIMARDMTAMAGLLHPDATFTSPAVFRPYQGRAAVLRVLTAATQTIEDFAYTGEAHGPGLDVLRFAAGSASTSSRAWTSSPPARTA